MAPFLRSMLPCSGSSLFNAIQFQVWQGTASFFQIPRSSWIKLFPWNSFCWKIPNNGLRINISPLSLAASTAHPKQQQKSQLEPLEHKKINIYESCFCFYLYKRLISMGQLVPAHFVHLVLPRKLLDVHGDFFSIYGSILFTVALFHWECLYAWFTPFTFRLSHRYLCSGPCWGARHLVPMERTQQNLVPQKSVSDIMERLYMKESCII